MHIAIVLSRAEVECLRSHLPDGTDLSRKLDQSELIFIHPTDPPDRFSNAIDCDESEAQALLRIASEHCSLAFEKIRHSMNLAGVR